MRHVPGTVSEPLDPPVIVLQILVGKSGPGLRNIELTPEHRF